MADRTASRLARLLDEERVALLSGDYDRLAGLAARKEALFARLPEGDPALPGLAAAVARNQRILEAAMRGLAAGREAIRDRQTEPPLTTYAADGKTTAPVGGGATDALDRRA
jgi:flagellar biosynthesis/type III secretory pathway chaperone